MQRLLLLVQLAIASSRTQFIKQCIVPCEGNADLPVLS